MADTLTVARYKIYLDYWQKHPPTHILLAHHVGYKHEEPKTAEDFIDLLMSPELASITENIND